MKKFLKIIVTFLALTLFLVGCSLVTSEKNKTYRITKASMVDSVTVFYNDKSYVTKMVFKKQGLYNEKELEERRVNMEKEYKSALSDDNQDMVIKSEMKNNVGELTVTVKVTDNTEFWLQMMLDRKDLFDKTGTHILLDKVELALKDQDAIEVK